MTDQEIINFRNIFDLPEKRPERSNRLRPLVFRRMSLSVLVRAHYPYMKLDKIAEIFFLKHDDIIYYLKKHEIYIQYSDYKHIYEQNKELLNEHLDKNNKLMREEDKLQIRCHQWFHNTHPKLRKLLNHNFNNPKDDAQGHFLKLMGLQKGRPDFTLYHNGGAYFGEMKTPKGTVEPDQKVMHALLRADGFEVAIIRTFEEFEKWVNYVLNR